jgi:hypothetical protein
VVWPSWSWSYGSWIYNYLCDQCLSPPKLWIRIALRRGVLDTTLCHSDWQLLYSWNIVESGTKHHNLTHTLLLWWLILLDEETENPPTCRKALDKRYIRFFSSIPRHALGIEQCRRPDHNCDICKLASSSYLTAMIILLPGSLKEMVNNREKCMPNNRK